MVVHETLEVLTDSSSKPARKKIRFTALTDPEMQQMSSVFTFVHFVHPSPQL